VAAELIRREKAGEKIPLDNDSEVARQLADWFSDQYDWHPDDADLRRLIATLLNPSRNSR
jgi:hypothetical protein